MMRRLFAASIAVALVACGQGVERTSDAGRGHSAATGTVAATVDGVPIEAAAVARYAREHDVSLEDALHALERFELLSAEAQRRGYGRFAEVRDGEKRAAVQLLLAREVEASTAHVDHDALVAAYAQHPELDVGEMRGSVHLLVKLDEHAPDARVAEGSAFIREAIARAGESDDVAATFTELAAAGLPGFEVITESIDPVDRNAPFAPPYLDALFATAEGHTAPQPVRTSFGLHAIHVTRIVPGHRVPLESVRRELADEVRTRVRHERTEELIADLRRAVPVERHEDAIQRAIARDLTAEPDAGTEP